MKSTPRIDQPQPGFYRYRRVRNGPWLAARIWRDDSIPERPAVLLAEMDGRDIPVIEAWPSLAGNSITEAEYQHLSNVRSWAKESAPSAPEAHPTKPINLAAQPAFEPVRR